MKPLFCHCSQCRHGRYRHKWLFRQKIRSGRRTVKTLLRRGEVERLPEKVYVGYVD